MAELSRQRAWALALIATFTMAVSYVDRQTLAVLAPSVCRDLGINETEYGWLASAFSIAYLVGAPLAGRWIDRVGSPRGLLAAVIVWSMIAALHAFAPGFAVLFMLRIALGLAESPSFPGAAQTVHRALPPHERARGMGILFTGSSFGAMIAPPLATFLAARWGWRGAFLGSALVGLIWVPIWRALAFERRAREVLEYRTEAAPAAEKARWIAAHPAVLRGIILVMASSPAMAFYFLWSSKFLVRHHGLEQLELGAYLLVPPLLFDVGAVVFGDLAVRRAKRRSQDGSPANGLVLAAAILQMTVALMPLAADPWGAMLIGGISMAGGGGLFALLTSDMLARVPQQSVSSAGGLTAASQSLAYIVANPLIGASVDRFQSYHTALYLLGAWILPGTLIWIFWRPPPHAAK
jgi:ACS family hexuronate transporter-like MFS transporter